MDGTSADTTLSFQWLLLELARAHDRELQAAQASTVQALTPAPVFSPGTPRTPRSQGPDHASASSSTAAPAPPCPPSLLAVPPSLAAPNWGNAQVQLAAPQVVISPAGPRNLPSSSDQSQRTPLSNGSASRHSPQEESTTAFDKNTASDLNPTRAEGNEPLPALPSPSLRSYSVQPQPSDRSRVSGAVNRAGVSAKSAATTHEYAMIRGWTMSEHPKHRTLTHLFGGAGLKKFVSTQPFEMFCAVAIVGNVIVVGCYADAIAAGKEDTKFAQSLSHGAICFSVWFALELALRMAAYKRDFFSGIDKYWNLFDTVVVFSDIGENFFDLISDERDALLQNLSSLRVLRILRITRVLKFIRAISFFKDFRMMVFSLLRSFTALFWSIVIFNLSVFIFSIYLMQNVAYYRHYDDSLSADAKTKLEDMFGTLRKSQYTLYKAVSGGQDWGEIARPLSEAHWFNGWVLCFYVFFTLLGVMNIITGIFVDRAIQSASNDRDEVISQEIENRNSMLRRLQRIFDSTDEDHSGTITMQEFEDHLKDDRVAASFTSIGLEVNEARGLFRLLDMDHSGAISIDEFVFGCMRLKGNAKSVDLVTLMYENKRMAERWGEIYDYMQANLDTLKEFESYVVSCLDYIVSTSGSLPKWVTPQISSRG